MGDKARRTARAERAGLKKALQVLLETEREDEETGEKKSGYEAVAEALFRKAASGDLAAFKELRDTVGEKPKEKQEVDATVTVVLGEAKEYSE